MKKRKKCKFPTPRLAKLSSQMVNHTRQRLRDARRIFRQVKKLTCTYCWHLVHTKVRQIGNVSSITAIYKYVITTRPPLFQSWCFSPTWSLFLFEEMLPTPSVIVEWRRQSQQLPQQLGKPEQKLQAERFPNLQGAEMMSKIDSRTCHAFLFSDCNLLWSSLID